MGDVACAYSTFLMLNLTNRYIYHSSSGCLSIYALIQPANHPSCSDEPRHGPLASYVKLRKAHAPGMPGTFSHVSRCMLGSLTNGFLWSRWRGNPSRYTQRMRIPQFYVSGKRPVDRTVRVSPGLRHFLPWLLPLFYPSMAHFFISIGNFINKHIHLSLYPVYRTIIPVIVSCWRNEMSRSMKFSFEDIGASPYVTNILHMSLRNRNFFTGIFCAEKTGKKSLHKMCF